MAFLPKILGKVAGMFLGGGRRASQVIVQQAPQIAAAAVGGAAFSAAGGAFARRGRRRRAKKALSLSEMGSIMVLGQALGPRSPVVTLAAMKALSGKL